MTELLEREPQLALLEGALAETRSEGGRNVLISGEAGIGKTSLIGQFAGRHRSEMPVLWGACDSLFAPPPLGPIQEIARQVGGELAASLQPDSPRARLFAATMSALQRRRTIIVLEDVHWADEATLDLLRFLGRRIRQTSALLIATYRDDALAARHPLRYVLGDLATSAYTRRVALPPLSENAVRQLVGNQPLDPTALHRQTGGNPFFVIEVVAHPRAGIPLSVRDAVLARMARLSPSGQAVLEAAAVAGQRVESWLLAAVTGAEAPAVDESLEAGILLAEGDRLAFRHELARQAILETISPLRRRVLHQLVLDALRSSPHTRHDLARLVHHARAASDHEAILAFAPAAASRATAAGNHRAAADLLELALTYGQSLPAADRARLLETHALACALINQFDTAVAERRQAIALWRSVGNQHKVGENLVYLAMALNGAGAWEEAAATRNAAVETLEPLPPGRELAMAYRLQALDHLGDHAFGQALPLAQKAAVIAEATGDPLVMAMTCDTLGASLMYHDPERGDQVLQRGLAMAIDAGLDARAATIYANHGSILCDLFRFPEAARKLAQGLSFTADRDLDMLRLYMLSYQALAQLQLGQWAQARNTASEVLQAPAGSLQSRFTALLVLEIWRTRRGEEVDPDIRAEIRQIADQSHQFDYIAPAQAAAAEGAWLAGDLPAARAAARAGYELALARRHPWLAGRLAFWLWRAGTNPQTPDWVAAPFALQLAGDWQAAAAAWEQRGCPYETANALADGDTDARMRALAIYERLGARPAAAALRAALRDAGVANLRPRPHPSTRQNPFTLTGRQSEVLWLLTEALTDAQIAARLHISPKTVGHHVSAILRKMDVRSREEAAAVARRHPAFQQK